MQENTCTFYIVGYGACVSKKIQINFYIESGLNIAVRKDVEAQGQSLTEWFARAARQRLELKAEEYGRAITPNRKK